MDGGSARGAVGSWRDLAMRAANASDRPEAARVAARTYEPELGDLDAFERARLLSTVEEIVDRDGAYVVPLHTSQPYWVPSMLEDGFRWERPRIQLEGGVTFEPYEDKLREYHGLGPGERSEDFLFAEARLVPRVGTLEQSLVANAARFRQLYGVGSRTASGFGQVTLGFSPDALIGATILPATRLLGQYGTRVGTIEHLPGIIASRVAIEGGARMDVERYGLRVHDVPDHEIEQVVTRRLKYRRQLAVALEAGHDERLAGVRGIIRNVLDNQRAHVRHPLLRLNPVEAHVRGLEPEHVRFLDIEDGTRVAPIAPGRLDRIEAAASRRNVPIVGIESHREAHRLMELRRPGSSAMIPDEPRRPTAIGTADLRMRMARRRAELGDDAGVEA